MLYNDVRFSFPRERPRQAKRSQSGVIESKRRASERGEELISGAEK